MKTNVASSGCIWSSSNFINQLQWIEVNEKMLFLWLQLAATWILKVHLFSWKLRENRKENKTRFHFKSGDLLLPYQKYYSLPSNLPICKQLETIQIVKLKKNNNKLRWKGYGGGGEGVYNQRCFELNVKKLPLQRMLQAELEIIFNSIQFGLYIYMTKTFLLTENKS